MKKKIKNISILDMVGEQPSIVQKDILIEQSRIEKIEPNIQEKTAEVIDGKGMLAMPGLINTHTHAGMSIFRAYQDEKKLMDWLYQSIFPKEKRLSPEDIYYASQLSIIEMLKSGTTMFNDMYFDMKETCKAVAETGIRAELSWSIDDENCEKKQQEILQYYKQNKMEESRIKLGIGLHAPYTCNPETIKTFLKLAKELKTNVHMHLAETKEELSIIKQRYGKTPTQYLKDLGVLELPVILAHAIYLTDKDISILKDIKGGISHNPISNCKLASGVCDIVKLRNAGIPVGLGTDGQGSTTTLDMFEEMKIAAYLQKLKYEDPTIIKAYDILKMATIEGAKVLGMEKEIGTIEIGKKADIILINIHQSKFQPMNDIVTNLVYSANGGDVDTVIVDGNILMQGRKLLNLQEEKIVESTRKIAQNIL